MSDKEFVKVGISMPEELRDAIDERLTYGDKRSKFIREAVKHYFDCECRVEEPPTP